MELLECEFTLIEIVFVWLTKHDLFQQKIIANEQEEILSISTLTGRR
jgi:hypothetical protein